MVSRRRLLVTLAVVIPALLAVSLVVAAPALFGETDYDRTSVVVEDENGTTLGSVDVRVADSPRERYVGLSQTASLDPNEGMLFVYEGEDERTYVMRNMSFPLDIVFVGANGTITAIHHAPVPEETESEGLVSYRGRAKWVLEVRRGWTSAHGVAVGDRISVVGRNR